MTALLVAELTHNFVNRKPQITARHYRAWALVVLHYDDFTTYEFAMTNDAMTTNLPPNQTLDTELSAQNMPVTDTDELALDDRLLDDDDDALDDGQFVDRRDEVES